MPFNQNDLPEWNATGVEPPQSKKDSGWGAGDKPPADWFNWFFNKAFNSLKNLFENAVHKEEKGAPNGVATLGSDGKLTADQAPPVSSTSEQVNKITAKLVTDLPSVYPIGISVFSVSGTAADPWETATGHPNGLEVVLVQTIKLTGDYVTVQRVTFNNASTGIKETYERSSHANNSWSGPWKKVVSREEVDAHYTDNVKHVTASERTSWETAKIRMYMGV